MHERIRLTALVLLLAAPAVAVAKDRPPPVKITNMTVQGQIEGENITFTVAFKLDVRRRNQQINLVRGDLVLDKIELPKTAENYRLEYDRASGTYIMHWPRKGTYDVSAKFAVRPAIVGAGPWREAEFTIPDSRRRELEVVCDRTDLEVKFPGALRVERKVERQADKETLTLTAVLGSQHSFHVRWKPHVEEFEAELVFAGEANTIANVSAGALRIDNLFTYEVTQGKLTELTFALPANLSIMQVRGQYIQDWFLTDAPSDGDGAAAAKSLRVNLNRPMTSRYAIQVLAEMALPDFPAEIDLPVLAPQGGIRGGGFLTIGTDSAIQLRVKSTGGLSQVEASAFPRLILDRQNPRPLPKAKAFHYLFAASPYQMKLSLDAIVPSFDANERIVVRVREDDLVLEIAVELDVRDAPIRDLTVLVPKAFLVAELSGREVDDHSVHEAAANEPSKAVEIHFRRPVLGRTLLSMRLELGASPLDKPQTLGGFAVRGAKNERGYLVIVVEQGVQLETPKPTNLRTVHTGSVPLRVPGAQHAYRFRDASWSLELHAREKAAAVRVESFHLLSVGEGIAYGSVVASYVITGAPVDELTFKIPVGLGLKNVEFVGNDVGRWSQAGDVWTVQLHRKITGDYNLGVLYNQRFDFEKGGDLSIGGVTCDRVATRTGYMVVASSLNLKIEPQNAAAAGDAIEIDYAEVPANYRLLVNAPVLKAYKYVSAPHRLTLKVTPHPRGELVSAVAEVMSLRTRFSLRDEGAAESVTTATYKVKNASEQYLAVKLPDGAKVWSTHLISSGYKLLFSTPWSKWAAAFEAGVVSAELRQEFSEHGVPLARGAVIQVEDKRKGRWRIVDQANEYLAVRQGKRGQTLGIYGRKKQPVTAGTVEVNGTKLLLIPLPRRRNPNDPITAELVYGQTHGELGLFGRIELMAPRSGKVRSTFSNWTLSVPKTWSIHPSAAGNMLPQPRPIAGGGGDFGRIVNVVREAWGEAWGDSLDYWVFSLRGFLLALAVIAGFTLLALYRRHLLRRVAALVVLVALVGLGIAASGTRDFTRGLTVTNDLTQIYYTQAPGLDLNPGLDLKPGGALTVYPSIVPAWRQHLTAMGAVLCPLLFVAFVALAIFLPNLRPLFVGGAGAALVYGAAQIPALAPALGHLLTWGLPLMALVWLLWRAIRPMIHIPNPISALRRSRSSVVSTGVILLAALLGGCGPLISSRIEEIQVDLKAEKDSMQVTLRLLRVKTRGPATFPLLSTSAILLDEPDEKQPYRVTAADGRYNLAIKKAGDYDITLKFLAPLPEPDDRQLRQFRIPLPTALTNRVSLIIPETDLQVEAPTAVRFHKEEKEEEELGDKKDKKDTKDKKKVTVARAILGPGDPVHFIWKPRARQTKMEKTSFFAEIQSLLLFDTGLVKGRHRVRFQIAQGDLKEIRLRVPRTMTVTAVRGQDLGAWRFDPTTGEVEARLARPATGEYVLSLATQISTDEMPFTTSFQPLVVRDAVGQQRGLVGLAHSSAVYLTVTKPLQSMNVDDFTRAAAALLAVKPAVKPSDVRHAFRVQQPRETLTVEVHTVRPELRGWENAKFTVDDTKLVFAGSLRIEVAKAGVFSVDLQIPKSYDIDSLTAPELSHWDERTETEKETGNETQGDQRVVQVHFKRKLLGRATLQIALSRAESTLPRQVTVPRVRLLGAEKHAGQVIIEPERSVRLSVATRKGVSELNPVELGIRRPRTLAFKLLRPDWELTLNTEVVQPRVTVEFLHVARVTEGLVRHTHYLRYSMQNAGKKIFEVQAPQGALGLLITGPDIAHKQETKPGSGRWRIELSRKWFDRPYPLQVRYETKFDREAGTVGLEPVSAIDVDLERGHVAIFATDRVELTVKDKEVPASLLPADARAVPRAFGAGDLSNAAYCYSSSAANYKLNLSAQRHQAADLLDAESQTTNIWTVVNERGESITLVSLQLRVSGKRNLETRLPKDADVWSLLVNRRSTVPSLRFDGKEQVVLIPVAHSSAGELPVAVEFVYVAPAPEGWKSGRQRYDGPRFDLPLNEITWTFYLPEGFKYDDFGGTLTVDQATANNGTIHSYGIRTYEVQVEQAKQRARDNVERLQQRGKLLAQLGQQQEAKQAYEAAYNDSFASAALNEDARVQRDNFNQQQAVVGLVGRRGHLRLQLGGAEAPAQQLAVQKDLGDRFRQVDAERLQSSLNLNDSKNLEQITRRFLEIQEAAAGVTERLTIQLPRHGRELIFRRALQVKPEAQMLVTFRASREAAEHTRAGWLWAGALGLLVALALALRTGIERGLQGPPAAAASEPEPQEEDEVEEEDEEPEIVPVKKRRQSRRKSEL